VIFQTKYIIRLGIERITDRRENAVFIIESAQKIDTGKPAGKRSPSFHDQRYCTNGNDQQITRSVDLKIKRTLTT
jgi:hypothetical protein